MYVERIEPYKYPLLCGEVFKSQTPSTPDDDGLHNFPCQRCNGWHTYTNLDIPALQAQPASYRDMRHAKRLDEAILKDRIVRDLRLEWTTLSRKDIARRHGVSHLTVSRIAAELGVPEDDAPYDKVTSYR